MAQPYVGEIRMFAGNFAPAGWSFCDGQLMPISENDVLFALIGTTYGGDGQQTFGVPDMRGRLPLHMGGTFVIGQSGGVESVSLTANQIPVHSHALSGSTNAASSATPSDTKLLGSGPTSTITAYGSDNPTTPLHGSSVSPAGGSQPHSNLQPYLCIGFIISLFGIFPSQT